MKKIILVEDDPFLIDIYVSRLKDEGYEVKVSSNGEKALEEIKKGTPDLLVLDIVMPKMDGWTVLKEISEKIKSKEIKVMILSNLGEKEEVERGYEMGASGYLIKANYTPTEVVEEIKKILE